MTVLQTMDLLRARVLQRTLRVPALRVLFFRRPLRLLVLFLCAALVHFWIALRIPLWSLVLGPLFLGLPHLASTVRFLPKTSLRAVWIGGVFLLAGAFRFYRGIETNGPELGIGLLFLGLLIFRYREDRRQVIAGVLVFSVLMVFSAFRPAEAIGALILIHNFIAFFYWIARADSAADRRTAIFALAVFAGITLLMLHGECDAWMSDRPGVILQGAASEAFLGSLIGPGSGPEFWIRGVSAYAFGQGLHYFVWLKAIPDQELRRSYTPSFRQSWIHLKRDLGKAFFVLTAVSALALLALACLVSLERAFLVYVAIAALHGYLEIAGLPFVRSKAA